jgi:hypothetical protein
MLLDAISVSQTPPTVNTSKPATSSESHAAVDTAGWEKLKQLTLYREAKVVVTSGETYQGTLIRVNDSELVIHPGTGDQTIARTHIQLVSIRRPGHRLRNALIGLAIGAGAGVGIGAYQDSNCHGSCSGAGATMFLPVLFGPIGAGVGALLPTRGWQEVYRLR